MTVNSVPNSWTLDHFLNEFSNITHKTKRKFCFLLGAGASASSDIRMADKLVEEWLFDLKLESDAPNESLENWATADNLSINGFDYARKHEFYSEIFNKRFAGDDDLGQAFIKHEIEGKNPSVGYVLLSQILSKTPHNIVVTTNFDDLVADAIRFHTDIHPKICHLEEMVEHADIDQDSHLILKVHGDSLFKQNHDTKADIPDKWKELLTKIFSEYYLIVIGYGGNDGGFIEFLQYLNLKKTNNTGRPAGSGIYWLYHLPTGLPRQKIQDLLIKQEGVLVPILGFDEVIFELYTLLSANNENVEPEKQFGYFLKKAITRNDLLSGSFEKLAAKNRSDSSATAKGFTGTTGAASSKTGAPTSGGNKNGLVRLGNKPSYINDKTLENNKSSLKTSLTTFVTNEKYNLGWRYWEILAQAESNTDERNRIYKEGLEDLPYSPELNGNYATFLKKFRKQYDIAESYYMKAIEYNRYDILNLGNYAFFLATIRKDFEGAKKYYLQALDYDPKNFDNNFRCAYICLINKHWQESYKYLKISRELNSDNINYHAALILLFKGIIACHHPRSDIVILEHLKWLFIRDFDRCDIEYDGIFEVFNSPMVKSDRELYKALYEAIKDKGKVSLLDDFPKWTKINPNEKGEPCSD